MIFYCFTAIVKRRKNQVVSKRIESEKDKFSQCPVHRETDLSILVKHGNKCLDYKFYAKFYVDRNMIELKIIVIHKSLSNDSKFQQRNIHFKDQKAMIANVNSQQTHSLQRSVSSDSKCLQTDSFQNIEKRNTHFFQQILILKYMNLKLYMMYDALLYSFRLIVCPELPDLSIEVLLTLNSDPRQKIKITDT